MITMFEKVRILKSGVTGIVVDIYNKRGKDVYIVEDDVVDADGNYELYDCYAEELTMI